MLARQFEKFPPLFQLMIGVAESGRGIKKALQKLFTLKQRRFTQVETVAVKKVECEINDRRAGDEFFARRADVHAFLEEFEITVALFVQSHDFAVQDCLA